jgi:hypothetical protein
VGVASRRNQPTAAPNTPATFTESLRTELMHEHSDLHITVALIPAVNTPQFSWVLSRLPNHPQPVPPIYQSEVAADHPQRSNTRCEQARSGPGSGRNSPDRCWTATWPAPATRRSRPAIRSDPTYPTTCGARRWRQRPRPRRARGLRQQDPRPATVGLPPRPPNLHRHSGTQRHQAGRRDHPMASAVKRFAVARAGYGPCY